MLTAVQLAFFSAAGIAMCSTIFGVCLARILWADDLLFAKKIDTIRSETEGHLRGTISSLESTVEIQRAALARARGEQKDGGR